MDVTGGDQGRVIIPVGLGAGRYRFLVDTGSAFSVVAHDLVHNEDWSVEDISDGSIYNGAATSFRQAVRVPKLQIGAAAGGPFWLLVGMQSPEHGPASAESAGVIGEDLLMNWDVELDLAEQKLKLFSPDHCPGRVVYWTPSYSEVPMEIDESRHIVLRVKLDGREMYGVLDTGASGSTLPFAAAVRLFGVTANGESVEKAGEADVGGATLVPIYRKRFHLLEIGDVAFKNPVITMMDMRAPVPDKGRLSSPIYKTDDVPRLILGVHELRMLRIYISYKERKLYISAAPAPPPPLN